MILARTHPAVRELDRIIRWAEANPSSFALHEVERRSQDVRKLLVGKPLRSYRKTGNRAKQKRLPLDGKKENA